MNTSTPPTMPPLPGAPPEPPEAPVLRSLYLDLLQRCLTGSLYKDPEQFNGVQRQFDAQKRKFGKDWPANAHTMIGEKRLHNVRLLTEKVIADGVPGDCIETGVWRGGACILMRAILKAYGVTDRMVYVADSFEGLPPPNAKQHMPDAGANWHEFSELAISLDEVKNNFSAYDLLDDNVVFLQGWFKDTLPSAPIDRLALLRLDGDMYGSTMDAITALYPKLSVGGYIIIDDYHSVPACKQAVYDYCTRFDMLPDLKEIDGSGVYWQKTT